MEDTQAVLLEFHSGVCGGLAKTTVKPAIFNQQVLTIEQDNLNTREDKGDDDIVVLDVNAQRQLYELLKKKFEG